MSEVWLRAGIVAGGTLLALIVVVLLRRRLAHPIAIGARGLGPGVYLFSSTTCADCDPARGRLEDALGASGFVEIRWEDEPELFGHLGIDAVPCTVVVSDDGTAVRHPGMPGRALEQLSP